MTRDVQTRACMDGSVAGESVPLSGAIIAAIERADDYFRINGGEPTVQVGNKPSKKYRAEATLRNIRDSLRAALSLLSVQVDGEQKITPLTKQELPGTVASVPSPAWRSDLENAPRNGSCIILGCATYVDAAYWDEGDWTLYPLDEIQPDGSYCMRFRPAPTHWMLLPAAPPVAETDADAPGDATRAEAMTRPIETAPRDGTSFIAIATAKGWGATKIARFLHADDRLPVPDGGGMWPSPPTHWAPLPVVTSISESDGPPSCADSGDIIAPPAKIPGPSDTTLSAEGIREALEQLVSACEQVFCSDATEKPTAELEPCSDDDAVMAGEDGDDRRLTFGMIRRARAALSALPVQSGQTNPHGAVDE